MARTIITLITTLAILYGGLCALLFFFQRSMLYFPQSRALPEDQFTSMLHTPEADLVLTVYKTAGPDAVIYFGGNAEDVSLSLPELRDAFPGTSLYLLHYRGYGGSSGRPSESALHSDALALYGRVSQDHSRITLIGRSLGSGLAIRIAAAGPVRRLVLITPYDSIANLAARQFPFVPVRWLLKDKFESWRYAPQIRSPTTLVVAERDEVTPEESASALYSGFRPGIAEYILIRGADHNTISASPDYVPALRGKRRENSVSAP
jgi:uncharacterized protein